MLPERTVRVFMSFSRHSLGDGSHLDLYDIIHKICILIYNIRSLVSLFYCVVVVQIERKPRVYSLKCKTRNLKLCRMMRKCKFCLLDANYTCKCADQLRIRTMFLLFAAWDSLVSTYEISRLWLASESEHAGLCVFWSETPMAGFLRTRLK